MALMEVAESTPVTCAAPSCSMPVAPGSQFSPACRQQCLRLYQAMVAAEGDFNAQLGALGAFQTRASTQESPSWETYATGIRMYVDAFPTLGVQRRHPSQLDGHHADGSTPKLEADAEQQLIRFVEWLGFSGTLAP